MLNTIDKVFGVAPQVLAIRSRRSALIAANIANTDTPHYKARDLDFAATLATVAGDPSRSGLQRTHGGHLGSQGGAAGETLYRQPSQPAMDGNTVESDQEHMAFMDNAIRYQASLNFLNGRISGLMLAIRGE